MDDVANGLVECAAFAGAITAGATQAEVYDVDGAAVRDDPVESADNIAE